MKLAQVVRIKIRLYEGVKIFMVLNNYNLDICFTGLGNGVAMDMYWNFGDLWCHFFFFLMDDCKHGKNGEANIDPRL